MSGVQRARIPDFARIVASLAVCVVVLVLSWYKANPNATEAAHRLQWVALANEKLRPGMRIEAADVRLALRRLPNQRRLPSTQDVIGTYVLEPLAADSPIRSLAAFPADSSLGHQAGEAIIHVHIPGSAAEGIAKGALVAFVRDSFQLPDISQLSQGRANGLRVLAVRLVPHDSTKAVVTVSAPRSALTCLWRLAWEEWGVIHLPAIERPVGVGACK